MTQEPYPLYIPQFSIASSDRDEWSKRKANEYFDWFMEIKDDRVGHLLAYFDQDVEDIPGALRDIGEVIIEGVSSGRYIQEDANGETGVTLTNEALAIGIDMALFIAVGLESTHPKLNWQIVRRPKNSISYSLPVLRGFEDGTQFDPLLIGMNCVWSMAEGDESSRLVDIYHYWLRKK